MKAAPKAHPQPALLAVVLCLPISPFPPAESHTTTKVTHNICLTFAILSLFKYHFSLLHWDRGARESSSTFSTFVVFEDHF